MQALANQQETPYPSTALGLGCCFPNYGPKGLLSGANSCKEAPKEQQGSQLEMEPPMMEMKCGKNPLC